MHQESNLKPAFERLTNGNATEADRRLIQQALFSGNLVYTTGEREVAIGGNVSGSLILTGDQNNFSFSLSEESFEKLKELIFPKPRGISPPFPEPLRTTKQPLGIVGNQKDAPQTRGVRGFPGVGKTTLVSVLSRDPDVTETYSDGVLWTSLEQKPALMSIFANWGRVLGSDDFLRIPTPDEAAEQLAGILQERKMLLIVDDVWEADHGALFEKARARNCGLLFTTRLPKVANALAQTERAIYALPVLERDEAIKLMRILAPSVVSRYEKECAELLKALEYLPLAIHVAARLLREELRNDWGVEDLLEDIKEGAAIIKAQAPSDRIEGEHIPTVTALLRKSTDVLDEQTRECFAFLGAFAPKPATFDLQAMQAVWQVADPKPTAKILLNYGLLEPVSNGRYQMHALLVAHAQSLLTND